MDTARLLFSAGVGSLIQFSIQLGRVALVRYRGHAPRMDYLALSVTKSVTLFPGTTTPQV